MVSDGGWIASKAICLFKLFSYVDEAQVQFLSIIVEPSRERVRLLIAEEMTQCKSLARLHVCGRKYKFELSHTTSMPKERWVTEVATPELPLSLWILVWCSLGLNRGIANLNIHRNIRGSKCIWLQLLDPIWFSILSVTVSVVNGIFPNL